MHRSVQENDEQNGYIAITDISQLKFMVESTPLPALLVDTSGFIIHTNDLLNDGLGYHHSELRNTSVEILIPLEYRHKHGGLVEAFFRAPKKRQMGKGKELYAIKKDGNKMPIRVGLNPLTTEGGVLVLVTLMDMTPSLEADRLFRQSIAAAPNGILVVNKDGKIQVVNKYIVESFGYKEKELINQPLESLLPERYREHHEKLRGDYLTKPDIRSMGVGRDLTALHKDGREFPVEIGLSPFITSEGSKMVIVSLTDITERKCLENALKETNTNLEEFTYVASHDLKSPLRGISDLLEWINDDLNDDNREAVLHNLNRISIRVNRMESLIDNLLTYARSGSREVDLEPVNIGTLLKEICALLQIPNGFKINTNLKASELLAAKTPLETVLRNIISNAIKHHDRDTGEISVTCKYESNMFKISISDDGPGIPESAQSRIFKLFQTLTSSERKGTGIGLSVCRRLAETHGGRISVKSNDGSRGVTFDILWPRFPRKDNLTV